MLCQQLDCKSHLSEQGFTLLRCWNTALHGADDGGRAESPGKLDHTANELGRALCHSGVGRRQAQLLFQPSSACARLRPVSSRVDRAIVAVAEHPLQQAIVERPQQHQSQSEPLVHIHVQDRNETQMAHCELLGTRQTVMAERIEIGPLEI